MNNINFSNPYLLLIAIPLLLIIIVPFFILIKKEGFNFHNITSLVIHIVIAIFLTLSVAQMTLEKNITETDVYVLADCSYSSNKNLDKIDEAINNLSKNLPDNSKIGVIAYGKDYKVVTELGKKFVTVKDSGVDDSETNVRDALEYTSGLFQDGVVKRIVVISDGVETQDKSISGLILNLEQFDIHIDAMYLDNTLTEDADEFQVSSVSYNESTYISKSEEAIVTIDSNKDVEAVTINVTVNGIVPTDKISEYNITAGLTKGSNKFSFELDTNTPGANTYNVTVSEYKDSDHTANTDTNPYNNSYIFVQNVSSTIKILFLSNDTDKGESELKVFESVYSDTDKYNITSYVNNDEEIPFLIEDLAMYDEIVLDNFNLASDTFKVNAESFINNVNTLVSTYGKSLITYGNTNTQNANSNDSLKTFSSMLPLSYGANNQAKSYTILLDISNSMQQASHLQIAKTATYKLLDTLNENDFYTIITFYGDCEILDSGRASAANIARAKKAVEDLQARQATNIESALKYAYSLIKNTNYKEKKVMLISDGMNHDSSNSVSTDMRELFVEMKGINITTSGILINENAETPYILQALASSGGTVNKILTEEDANGAAFDAIIDNETDTYKTGNFSVKVVNKNHEVVDGVNLTKTISEFYKSSIKANATNIVNVVDNSTEYPLYSTWKYGEGNVSCFASLLNKYAKENTSEAKFCENIATTSTPKNNDKAAINVEIENEGSHFALNVTTENISELKEATIRIVSKNMDEKFNLSLNSSYYFTNFELNETGTYRLEISIDDNIVSKYVAISYFSEYDSFQESDPSFLYNIITTDGTVNYDLNLSIDNSNIGVVKYKYEFTPLLMILSVILFIADIAIRKLKLQDIKSLFKKGAKR